MKQHNIFIVGSLTLAMLVPTGLQAQTTAKKDTTMNRTVVVEQEYNPDILDASKVNVLPKVEAPTVSKKEVEYATTLFPATSIPAGLMTPYTGKETQSGINPGYVRAGYGNYGNLDLLANYLFRLSERDKLNIRFQMDGMDGKLTMPETNEDWKAYYYQTRANMDFTHQFDKLDLNIAANFGLSNFNFLPITIANKQKFTSGDIHIGVNSSNETAPLQYSFETNLMMYNRQKNGWFFSDALGETQVYTKGLVSGAINDEQAVSIQFQMHNLIYGKDAKKELSSLYESRTALGLNPYYELNSDSWKLHLGANIDFSFGNGKTFRASPDLVAQFLISESYILYAKATGGKSLNDFRRLETFCPYALPTNTIEDTYEQLNASIGFKASPYPGLWFNLFGGYQDLKNDLYQIPGEIDNNAGPNSEPLNYQFVDLGFSNSHNAYAGMKISYEYKDIIGLSATGTYRNWETKEDIALLFKPSVEFNFNINFCPIKGLNVNAGYDYIGREKIKDYSKLSAVSNLYAGASYNVFKGVSVYARLNNLLNEKYQYYIGYPTEGLNVLGGLSFSF